MRNSRRFRAMKTSHKYNNSTRTCKELMASLSLSSPSLGSDIAVVLVFVASCLLLFFDLGVIAKAKKKAARSTESFVVEAQTTSRPGDLADPSWRKDIEQAFLSMLGRFPSLSETRTFLSFLASERALRGGEIPEPRKEIADLLRNTHDYRAGEIAGYLKTGNDDAGRRSASVSVKNFTRDYYGLASPLLSEHEARMARVYSAFSTLLNRRPTPRELDYMKRFASSPTRVKRAIEFLRRQQKEEQDQQNDVPRTSSFTLVDSEEIAVRDQQTIADVYREVYSTDPPVYVPALLRDAYVRRYDRNKTELRKHLVDMMERARDGRCYPDGAPNPEKTKHEKEIPVPLVTRNSFTSISVPHARVGEGENFDGLILSNTEIDAFAGPPSDRLDAWGKLQIERQALIAETQDTVPDSNATWTERRMLAGVN